MARQSADISHNILNLHQCIAASICSLRIVRSLGHSPSDFERTRCAAKAHNGARGVTPKRRRVIVSGIPVGLTVSVFRRRLRAKVLFWRPLGNDPAGATSTPATSAIIFLNLLHTSRLSQIQRFMDFRPWLVASLAHLTFQSRPLG